MYSKLFCFFILLSFITVSCVDNCGDLFGDSSCEDCINSVQIFLLHPILMLDSWNENKLNEKEKKNIKRIILERYMNIYADRVDINWKYDRKLF